MDTGDPGGTFLNPGGLPRPTQDTRTECKRPQSSRDTSGMDILDWLHGIVAGESIYGFIKSDQLILLFYVVFETVYGGQIIILLVEGLPAYGR